MLLEHAKSSEEVADALAAGDQELANDIEEQLKALRLKWERRRDGCEYRDTDLREFLFSPPSDFVDAVIEQSPPHADLSQLDRQLIENALEFISQRARDRWHAGIFELSSERGARGDFRYSFVPEMDCWFPSSLYPDGAIFIPQERAAQFWKSDVSSVSWNYDNFDEDNFGHREGTDSSYIVADVDSFHEWCFDLIAENVNEWAEKDPDRARAMFWAALRVENSSLADRLEAVKPSPDDVLNLAVQWFKTQDNSESLDNIREYLDALAGTDEERANDDVIRVVDENDLRRLGITSGTLWEERPWKLIRLFPYQLANEGAQMRHCVGDRRMGYIQAIKDGEVQIWSLRSRANKPRFTLEVDSSFYDAVDDPKLTFFTGPRDRGRAIKQLKGKANRTPGYAEPRSDPADIRFPDEVKLWAWLFRELNVDPGEVHDFRAYHPTQQDQPTPNRRTSRRRTSRRGAQPSPRRNSGEVCTGFDMPYRPLVEEPPER